MTLAFARAYEQTATRITGPVSFAALRQVAALGHGTRILDVAAGTGALSVPAAHAGAAVTAIDIAPGMVELLTERLSPFPAAQAVAMNGEALSFPDGSFDAALSVFGVSLFSDWRRGLAELTRVVRVGGQIVVATWRTPPGGGPFVIMAEALRATFPDRPAPAGPEGFITLAAPDGMTAALTDAGLIDVQAQEIEAMWEGPAGPDYLAEMAELHSYMGPYAALDPEQKQSVDRAILDAVDRRATAGRLVMKTMVTLATGLRPATDA
ncbi:class I SAM-dependent methyltransferase [Sphingomonas sp. ASY06-1R]|uniref:class I SAM-dependent methyltransferase n=1 Tax=Sphingomonas sp. ASY06-1R TaxID=3445771 RepID=UPI003FA1EA14